MVFYCMRIFPNIRLQITCTNALFIVYQQIGEAGKLKPLEVDLKRLEDLSDSIVQDFAAMRKREEEMRSTNGKWNKIYSIHLLNFVRFWSEFFILNCYRINDQSCVVLQHIQHVLFAGIGHMASAVPAKILQGKETYRINEC